MASAGPIRAPGNAWSGSLSERDWSATPLGPVTGWPPSLVGAFQVMQACRQPMFIWWGAELVQLGNEAFASLFDGGAAAGSGSPASEAWRENWPEVSSAVEALRAGGDPMAPERIQLSLAHARATHADQHWFALTPIHGDSRSVAGILGVYQGGRRGSAAASAGRPRVLLAIDDAELREHILRLAAASYELSAASSRDEVRQLVRDEQPDLVIVGPADSEANGEALAKVLRTDLQTRDVPILELTNDAAPESADAQGGVLNIPFSARELLVRLEAIFAAARVRRESLAREDRLRAEVIDERSRVEAALRESNERFVMFMKHLPGLAWIKDVEGRYVYVNDAAERAFQKPRAELYGRADEEIFPPETARQFRENDRRTLAGGGPVETIETLQHADGLHHSLVSKFAVPNADGQPTLIGGIAIDMTERIKAEQALRDSEERFRAITMNAPVAIFIKDLEGRYTLCNPLASQALGRPEGAAGFTDHDLLPAAAADQIRRRDLEIIESGDAAENEEVVPAGGVNRQFLSVKFPLRSAAGEIVGVCGVAVDVTERKQTQQALLESERRLVVATQAGKVGVWAWDLVANRVSWSESLQTIVGIGPGDFASTVDDFETLVHPDDRQRVQQAIEHALAHDDAMELEFRAIRTDGDFMWLYTNAAVLRDNGRAVRLLGATLDITERKRGEIALRDSEERFRTLASHAPVGIFQADAEGRTIFVNEGWCQMAGLTPEQSRGDAWATAIHPEDRPRVVAGWNDAVRNGQPSNAEFRFLHPDGQVIWLQGNAVPLRDPAGQVDGFIGTIVDITGRKEVEAALRNSERMYRAIGESIDYGIWVCDPDGKNIYCSESFLNLTGMTQQQCSDMGWGSALHPDDIEQTFAAWQECVRMGDAWDIEHRFRGVDGQWHPVLARGVPVKNDRGEIIAWVGINLDISELKRVENDLRESEARFRNVADNAPVLIWMNGVGGCQFVNKEYLNYVGAPVEKLLGMGWVDYLHPEDAEQYVEKFVGAFEKKQPFEGQMRMRRADGAFRWLSTTSSPRFRADGEFLGFIGCSVDITEIKNSEAALREADRRKDDFLAMLGHELRNPLAGIVTGAQVLSLLDLDAEAGEMQAVIARQATYMSRIVDDLLDVSRIARGKLRLRHQHANLRDLLRNAVEDYRKGHSLQDCELHIDVPDEEAWVWADPARLTQAFSNVIHNACKFSDGPNVVSVAMTIDHDARQAKIVISDRGIGMSPETVARIFQPFIQADTSLERSRGGLGLGLALGRGLVHLHGGTVTASSPGLGRGSSFTITLPLVAAPQPRDASSQAATPQASRVLIIDDRRDAILPLRKMLEMDGHTVATAEDGPAGLERAAEFRPDIVLCDIGLVGEMDGYGVCRAVRAAPEFSSLYLVAVTGYGHEEARRMAKEAGFDFHLTKPVSMQQVRHLVGRRPGFTQS